MNRPDGFDAALIAYLPQMERQANYIAGVRGEDLLQDTVTDMLRLADKCRMASFRTWAQIIMMRSASNYLRAARREKRSGIHVPETVAYAIGIQPNQEAATDLSAAVVALAGIRDGEAIIREAMGETLTDIGRERGIGREAMRQRRELARLRLNDQMRMAA